MTDAEGPIASATEIVFTAALDLPPGERQAFLAARCGQDLQLRQRVEALLQAHEAPGGFLPEIPVGDPVPTRILSAVELEEAGDTIGRYKLREQIGEGGCGVVYMAEQESPVRRRVALKIIKLGMDTKQVVARFEAERQALAMMDHPNIAKVLDAGATETGRPYFVMELVGGIKITDYCNQNKLSIHERLDLFIQVCRAIQHAHQKGIIHRDIKPSNVLVGTQDGVPVPKVIDFGIAKATQGRLTDQTLFTAFEQFIGTPAYMSPEQAQLGGLDVDTRSDIYSLGVLLYELLTGKTPFESKELLASGLEAMRRTICEKEPATPSTRLKQDQALAQSGSSGPAKGKIQNLKIADDLDWIVMKCLEKDRSRRYETANGLAKDLERHLTREPVAARPPSAAYKVHKFIQRNRSVTAIAVALVLGIMVSSWEAVRATHAKTQALGEKARADEAAAKQEAINRFLNDVLASADPTGLSARDQTKGPNVTMMQVLDSAARQLAAGSMKNRPEIEASICQTLGKAYLSLGEARQAEPLLRKVLELNRSLYGELSEETAGSLVDMSEVYGFEGKGETAREFAERAVSIERSRHGKEHAHLGRALLRLAGVLDGLVRSGYGPATAATTEAAYREALTIQRKVLDPQNPEIITTLRELGTWVETFPKNHVEAEELIREALRKQLALRGEKHPDTAEILNALGLILCNKNDVAEAERMCLKAFEIQHELFGSNSPALRSSYGPLTEIFSKQQKFPEAEQAIRGLLALNRRAIPGGLDVAYWLQKLADNLVAQKRLAEAEDCSREALQIWQRYKHGGVGHESYWDHLEHLVAILSKENKIEAIEELYRGVLDLQRMALGDAHVALAGTMCRFAEFLASCNKADAAASLYHEVQAQIPKLGMGRNRLAYLNLANSLRSRGCVDDAEEVYRRLIHAESENSERPNFYLSWLLHDFGDLLGSERKFEAAVEQYLQALQIQRLSPDDNLNWTLRSLGRALIACSRPAQAEQYLREALDLHRTLNSRENIQHACLARDLGNVLAQQGRFHEAEQFYANAILSFQKCSATGTDQFAETVKSFATLLESQGKLGEAQEALKNLPTRSEPSSR